MLAHGSRVCFDMHTGWQDRARVTRTWWNQNGVGWWTMCKTNIRIVHMENSRAEREKNCGWKKVCIVTSLKTCMDNPLEFETESTAVLSLTGLLPSAREDSCWPGQQFFFFWNRWFEARHVGIHWKGIFMRNLNLESLLWLARLLSQLTLNELTLSPLN